MQKSEQINELTAAFAKARAAFKPVRKESTNPFFKSKYADLSVIIEATAQALSENGLAVFQFPGEVNGGQVTILTMLSHASGQWVSEETTMPVAKSDAQGIGSALTYGRRYALQSVLNVAAEDDDDGNFAVKPTNGDVAKDAQKIAGAKDLDDLRAVYEPAFKKFNGNTAAQSVLVAAKDKRKQELQ